MITSKRDSRSPSALDDQYIQTAIVLAEKKDTDLNVGEYKPKAKVESESKVASQMMDPTDLTTTEEQLEKQSFTGSGWL